MNGLMHRELEVVHAFLFLHDAQKFISYKEGSKIWVTDFKHCENPILPSTTPEIAPGDREIGPCLFVAQLLLIGIGWSRES
jgi:hypothetical protein